MSNQSINNNNQSTNAVVTQTYTCKICKIEKEGYGNNPYPLCERNDYTSRCCDECNFSKVIPMRMIHHARQESGKKLMEMLKEGTTIKVKWDISNWKDYVDKKPKLQKEFELSKLDEEVIQTKIKESIEAYEKINEDFDYHTEINEIVSNYLSDHIGWLVEEWKVVQ